MFLSGETIKLDGISNFYAQKMKNHGYIGVIIILNHGHNFKPNAAISALV